jgi:hypothetical protein
LPNSGLVFAYFRKLLKQLGILNAAGVETLFPKEAMSLPNPTFYKTVNIDGSN